MASIFVSYRREDSAGHAGRLFDQLKLRFGQKNVFWDVSGSIEPGEPFDGAIERAVASCDALLAIIGPTWVISADAEGKRRIDDPHDFVRLEIGKALRRNVRVVPVLVHRATMPRMEELPGDLQPIARHQAIELSDSRWDHDVSQLIQSLDRKIGRQDWWQRLWRPIAVAAAVVLLSAGGVGLWVIQQERDTTPVVPQPSSAERTPSGDAVSRTPSPSQGDDTTGAPELVAVPDVERLPLDVARTRLAEAQLRVGQTSFYTLDRYDPGTVYHQKSSAGARVRPGSAIDLYVVREKLPGIESSGLHYLSPTEVIDLDGESTSKSDEDIQFDASGQTERNLQPINGAEMAAVGRDPVNRDGCANAALSDTPVRLQVGTYLCVRTNRGRYALLRIEDVGRELKLSYDTWASEPAVSDTVRLGDRESFHFKTGKTGRLQGGDFYLTIDDNGAAQFYANNSGQRGLVDLGDIGKVPLDQVPLPDSGYYQFGIPVAPNHTYVSLARAGEDGHYVVFRVEEVSGDSVMLSYKYR